VMKLLIARCKKLDNKDKEGKTALHWAVLCDCVGVVQRLLEKGASVKVEDEKGRTPLHVAVTGKILDDTKKKEAIVKILLKHGADSDAKDAEGKTPLQKM
ncbi:ankyrin, partial [Stipitochalara longipes BDJ]